MSRRLRSTPWWEDCASLGHADLKIEGPVDAAEPTGVFFATCSHCVRACTRRRRLAQEKIVIVLDCPWFTAQDFYWLNAPGFFNPHPDLRWGFVAGPYWVSNRRKLHGILD